MQNNEAYDDREEIAAIDRECEDCKHLGKHDCSALPTAFDAMAFDGQFRETLQYMADCYRKLSSGRDSIEGERN